MTWVRTDDGGARGDRQAGTVLVGSPLGSLQQAFRLASEPTLTSLQGRFQATIAGPSWVRLPALLVVHVTGMPGWWGKEFAVDERGDALMGHNVVMAGDALYASLPMRAVLGCSRTDGRPALVLTYGSDAGWPWRRVTDEVRSLNDGTLIGLSFGLPLPPGGSPFLLRPDSTGRAPTRRRPSTPTTPGGAS